ncbi:MAG: hypothetical protein CSA35_08110 [Dethiosulfovibrio peptidovorans]|nr:MAG: hypothetical protein CSA35_08110 [Dethiosulfovibrio peptidovorans]
MYRKNLSNTSLFLSFFSPIASSQKSRKRCPEGNGILYLIVFLVSVLGGGSGPILVSTMPPLVAVDERRKETESR